MIAGVCHIYDYYDYYDLFIYFLLIAPLWATAYTSLTHWEVAEKLPKFASFRRSHDATATLAVQTLV